MLLPKYPLIILLFLITVTSQAQKARALPKQYAPLSINVGFGAHLPLADMSSRFGLNTSFSGGVEYISLPQGWLVGIDGFYQFGNTVNEDVLRPLRTQDGNIIGDINQYASVVLRQRGYNASITVGKIFKLFDNGNRMGGIRLSLGSGYWQHWIRIQDDSRSVPHLSGLYKNGYDRLSSGIAFSQFVGYQVVSRDKTVNFFIGIEATEGMTRNRRRFNFDTRSVDDRKRLDAQLGLRVGWSLPIFTNVKSEDIEY